MNPEPLTEKDTVFDGFCHRNFIENVDGWRNETINESEFPSIAIAKDIVSMYSEINQLRYKIWKLEKENKHLKSMLNY